MPAMPRSWAFVSRAGPLALAFVLTLSAAAAAHADEPRSRVAPAPIPLDGLAASCTRSDRAPHRVPLTQVDPKKKTIDVTFEIELRR